MAVERAGYTVTMFVIDVSTTMGNIREVEVENPDRTTRTIEMTNLQWSLHYVKLKVQEMIFNGRKTDQCGVVIFGTEETSNVIHDEIPESYKNIVDYIPIAQPNSSTIAKIDALQASPTQNSGDAVDALIVAAAIQDRYLKKKKWTRKIIMVTDGEGSIEVTDEIEETIDKLNEFGVKLTIVGVDFDDEELPYAEPNKSYNKRANEQFYKEDFLPKLNSGVMGTCAYAIQETSAPEVKNVKSALMGTVLRIGDVEARSDEAIELPIKTSKCTSYTRPRGWKKYALRKRLDANGMEMDQNDDNQITGATKDVYGLLKMKTEYLIDRNPVDPEEQKDDDVKIKDESEDVKMEYEDDDKNLLDGEEKLDTKLEQIEKEDLIRGFKYGTTYAPCPDGQFPRLETQKGMDICGFFPARNFRRELAMGELQYVWADPNIPSDQVALSSIARAMEDKEVMAIARWVTRDGMDPKMGVLSPVIFENVDALLWIPMPFADDVRKFTFASLETLINKKGEVLKEHPYLPTQKQLEAMDSFVDAMDLMDAGEKDEEGGRMPWFDPMKCYNPALYRIKQAMFHAAVVEDVTESPLPPPHPETVMYFEPPKKAVKRARDALEECKSVFNVKQVVRATKAKKAGHSRVQDDEDDEMLLLDQKRPVGRTESQMSIVEAGPSSLTQAKVTVKAEEDSATEDEDDEEMLLDNKKKNTLPPSRSRGPLPTPARSVSPQIDPGRAPGRIIGTTYPLKDFQKNIAQGDVVTKAVQDLSAVIAEIIMKPFASRRADEMLECMFVLRETCLEEDEIDSWNTFIRDLKAKCLSRPGNESFWAKIQEHGRELSLISKQEAKRQGGDSEVTENEAGEFTS